MNHYQILANASEEQLNHLASLILEEYTASQIRLLSGPQRGLVMLRVRESVANSLFNAGEVLVTEVKLELDGQFGYGMVIGDSSRKAMAIALVDAVLRKGERIARQIEHELAAIQQQIKSNNQRMFDAAATTRVDFEIL
jgi:alpha-D-ribose 1-methylphosphonate 5-triphosphate synthase subunit PhnG